MSRHVILVDEQNHATGTMEIVAAHSGEGTLHRAFSVYVFSPDKSSLIIQQRSNKKMLFPLIWANTCCSHPLEKEEMIASGQRRLKEELGFSVPLKAGPSFVYRAKDPDGKGSEYEHVTTLIGTAPKGIVVRPDPDEAAAWKWIDIPTLLNDLEKYPDFFALWLKIGLEKILDR
ncbi:MAG: isopentenyl-diphosphate Delta-isomerase [Candidatus Peribacteraceae bacterium]|nr:isopentenyl-diphosphate Delta-isomerase [Candidatus Peribacteraceae bacterium]